MELWGGVECTVNRVGNAFYDQVGRLGHDRRPGDIELIAGLGIRALRFPALWERMASASGAIDWRWTDEVLPRLRSLGIRPIVGFLHHGSGPPWTDMLQPDFADGLGRFAACFAQRYPWIDAYTPVNEPLTTARFSGLYGHWYPHAADDAAFLRILFNECAATAAAMQAVRAVNSHAQLIQTEDTGRTSSTPLLRYQANFDNERRWLGLDVLFGRVDSTHGLWGWITSTLDRAWVQEHAEHARCPPDIVGLNHYVTSNRYLDENIANYPAQCHGGNWRHRYADIEAVRAVDAPVVPLDELLDEAWTRYGKPLAITEAHLGCTREEQARWFLEIWRGATRASERGIDVRAVTAWTLLGAYDWDSLVTRDDGHYECGVFDVRAGLPRPTYMCELLRGLATGHEPSHPVLEAPGWWRRARSSEVDPGGPASNPTSKCAEILITGRRGTLGAAFAAICEHRGLRFRLLDRAALDIADMANVEAVMRTIRPWAVINAAGYCRVDDAEGDEARCRRENAQGLSNLAAVCAVKGIPLVTFSSDLVFDGLNRRPYLESDDVCPLNAYGRSKRESEVAVAGHHPSALIIRTSAFFGPWDQHNFLARTLRSVARGDSVAAACDVTTAPTYLPDLVNATLDLLIDGAHGIWHLANVGEVSWSDFARIAASVHGYEQSMVRPVPGADLGWRAKRPAYSVLGTDLATGLMPVLEDAMSRYAREARLV